MDILKIKIKKIRNSNITNSYIYDVIVGIVLGDGHLEFSSKSLKNKSNCRLRITFSTKFEKLALYTYGLLCYYYNSKGYVKNKVKSHANSKYYERISLTTVVSPLFTNLHKQFYRFSADDSKYIKIIPLDVEKYLTNISLAFFIMDAVGSDGNYNKVKKVFRLYTQGYTKLEVLLLSKAIFKNFGIISRLEKTSKFKEQYIIVIKTSEVPKLQNLVKDHIHPSMLYRIGLDINTHILTPTA